MKCPDEITLAVYADGELSVDSSGDVAAHLDVCRICKEQVRLLEAESRWLTASLRELDACVEGVPGTEVRSAGALPVEARPWGGVWPLAALVTGVSLALALVLDAILSFRVPAGFEWLDPSGMQGQLTFLVSALFYVAEEGVPMIASAASSVSFAVLNLLALGGLVFVLRRGVRIPTSGLLAGLMLVIAAPGHAIDIRSVDNGAVTIQANETVDDTLVIFAQSVNIDGVVTGSVIAFGLDVNVRGTVRGNLIAAARRITVDGSVEGDLAPFAQTVTLAGQVGGNLWAFNESLILEDTARVDGDSTVFGADGDIEGEVGRDLTMFGALLNVGGLVERSVNFSGGQLVIRAPAVVGGDVTARVTAEENVQIDPGAQISGNQSIELREPADFDRFSRFVRMGFYVRQILRVVAGFVVGLLLFLVLPGLARVDLGDAKTLAISGGVGFLVLVATPVAAVVLAITLIGLPLAFLTGVTWVMGLYLAKIIVAQFIGATVIGRKPNGVSTGPGLLFGIVIVVLAVNIPFVGGLINFILVLLGLGALAVGLYGLMSGNGPASRSLEPAV